jgi:hypothetical protein
VNPIALALWPCGCTNIYGEMPPHATWQVAYECSWCDAVISRRDMLQWFTEAKGLPPTFGTCRMLMRVGADLVETDGDCEDCGLPFVRERVYGARWSHLTVPMSAVEILRN